MTIKQFWIDPYQTRLETHITTVDGCDVTVDATILYAFSGGQESDAGTLGGHPVRTARKQGTALTYALDAGHGLAVGDAVTIEIDWERRHALMRLHFAAELVLELICRELPGVVKIGAHIAADKARIDFAWPESVAPRLPGLVAQVAEIVAADLPVESAFEAVANERRYWQIEGFARVPCGGTHLRRTSEVGRVALSRRNPGRGKERIEIRLSDPPLPG